MAVCLVGHRNAEVEAQIAHLRAELLHKEQENARVQMQLEKEKEERERAQRQVIHIFNIDFVWHYLKGMYHNNRPEDRPR